MRSKTSFFNKTVFAHDLKRFWPLTAAYTLLWLLILPLSRLTELNHYPYLSAWNAQYETLGVAVTGGIVGALIAGILFAMAAFSYLTNPRATNGLHALSARRETLYVTHCLAGLVSQLAPQLLAVGLTGAVLAAHGAFDLRALGLMLLALALPTLFFYLFGVFCMMFTGQILAAPVFYGVLNVLAVGVEVLVKTFAGNFLYGWDEFSWLALAPFSPIVRMAQSVRTADSASKLVIVGLGWLWCYAAAGLVLAALGLLVYRKRHSEATGSIVAVGWARPIFRYGVSFCAALALGQLLYYLFFGQYRASGDYSLPGTLACMAAAGLIGYFAAEMLLRKSFRVWKTGWKGAAAVTAVLVALGFALSLDLTGYEGYVPDVDRIAAANVSFDVYSGGRRGCHVTVSDPEALRLVTDAHRALVNDKSFQQARQAQTWRSAENDENCVGGYFTVTYTRKDGSVVSRRYNTVTLDRRRLNDPASPAAALTALYNDPDVALMRALGRYGYYADNDPRALPDLRFTGGYCSRQLWDGDKYLGSTEQDLTPAQAKQIFDAILRDAAAGRLTDSLFDETESGPVELELFGSCADVRNNGRPGEPGASTYPAEEEDGRVQIGFSPVVTPRMTETVAALRAAGIETELN